MYFLGKYIVKVLIIYLNFLNGISKSASYNKTCESLDYIVRTDVPQPVVILYRNISIFYEWIFKVNISKLHFNPDDELTFEQTDLKFRMLRHNYVIFVDDFEELDYVISFLFRTNEFNTRGHVLINFQKSISRSEVSRSFLYLYSKYIYRTVIHTIEGEYMAWYPYHPKSKCGTRVHISRINCSRIFRGRVPDNLNNCPVTISWNMYAIFMWNPFNETFPGALPIFINTIGKILKFQPIYLTENSDYLLDFLKTNSFVTGRKDVENRKIDLIIYGSDNGHLMDLENLQDLVKSVSYYLLVPSTLSVLSNFYFNIFNTVLLYSTLLSLFGAVILWKMALKQSFLDSLFTVYRITFQLTVPKVTKHLRARFLFLAIILFAFFLNCKYNTYLSSILTSPGEVKKLGSLNQIDQIYTGTKDNNSISRFLYFTGLNQSLGRTADDRWVVIPNAADSNTIMDTFLGNYSQASFSHMEHFQHFSRTVKRLQISSEQRMTGIEYKIASRRGFPINEKLNYWIECTAQTGLLEKWKIDQSVLLKKFIIEKPGTLIDRKLILEDFRGSFFILFLGWTIALTVFILEIILFRNGYYRDYLE